MTYLIRFNDQRAIDPETVGQKFAALAHAIRQGFPVPDAASITTEAHRYFTRHRTWPSGLVEEVRQFSARLGLDQGLSVRSSAVREDLDSQSFAGQYLTFLRVYDPEDLCVKIEKCWLSTEGESVRSYLQSGRSQVDSAPGVPLMGVILQRMIDARAGGVAFSRNPVNSIKEEIVIEAVAGSGERLVNGHVSPYRAYVERNGGCRYESPIDLNNGNSTGWESPMTREDWQLIAELLKRLESACGGKYLDMEWAIDSTGKPWLLQYRGITTTDEREGSAPPGLWTRRIADDLWADRLTPVLADAMVKKAQRYDMSRMLALLDIPVEDPTLAVIKGYLYVNGDALARVVNYIPRRLRSADLRAFFPTGFDTDALPRPGLLDQLSTGLRALLLPVFEPSINPLVCLWRTRHHRQDIEQRIRTVRYLPENSPLDAYRRVLCALETMAQIQANNQWPYFHAAFFTILLRWLTVDLCGDSHAAFLNFIGSGGRNVSIDIERHFRRMAQSVQEDTGLMDLFSVHDPESVYDLLPRRFKETLQRFLDRYGCRSRHRTLYIRRWAEAPDEVIGILQKLVRQPPFKMLADGDGPGSLSACGKDTEMAVSPSDRRRSTRPSGGFGRRLNPCRLVQPGIRKLARRFLDLREDLRFLLDKALYDIRLSLLQLGKVTGLGENILFLNLTEIDALVNGSLELGQAQAVAAKRHHAFLEPVSISTFYIDGRPVEPPSTSSNVFEGVGTSPGRASGRARIVSDPSRDPIQKGDILVAQNTDPGWTPIISLAAGMVMEEGGLLNHCSIIARELRIPAVVGIHQATRRIKDGEQLTVDGGQGWVRIEAPE
jgi:pyruvate,water dikinase